MRSNSWLPFIVSFAAALLVFQAEARSEDVAPSGISLLTVDEAVRFGILHSAASRYARMNAIETMRLGKLSIRKFFPKLGVSYSESDGVRVGVADSREKRLEFSLTQPVFDGGKSALEHEIATLAASYAYQDCIAETRQLEARIAGEYLELALKKANLAIQDVLLQSAGEQLSIAKSEYENGVSLESDYLECMINRSGVEYDRIRLAREYESAERRFKMTLGLDEAIGLEIGALSPAEPNMRAMSANIDAICERALAVSADLARKRSDLRVTEAKTRRACWDFAPNVSLRCSLGFTGDAFPLTEPSFSVSVIFGFDNPVFPGSFTSEYDYLNGKLGSVSNSAQVSVFDGITWNGDRRLAEISLLRARLDCERAERELRVSIRDGVYSRDDALSRRAIKAETIRLMEKKSRIGELRAARGELKRVDLLDEMIALAKARTEMLSIESELANLERSLAIALDIPFVEGIFEIK